MEEEKLKFGITINPNYIPEGKEGISNEGWKNHLKLALDLFNGKIEKELSISCQVCEVKWFLSFQNLEDLKCFLKYIYGIVDYNEIYLWSYKMYDLFRYYESLPRPDLDIWRCL